MSLTGKTEFYFLNSLFSGIAHWHPTGRNQCRNSLFYWPVQTLDAKVPNFVRMFLACRWFGWKRLVLDGLWKPWVWHSKQTRHRSEVRVWCMCPLQYPRGIVFLIKGINCSKEVLKFNDLFLGGMSSWIHRVLQCEFTLSLNKWRQSHTTIPTLFVFENMKQQPYSNKKKPPGGVANERLRIICVRL